MRSLGDALMSHWSAMTGGPRLTTYTRKGWHAQLSQLTGTRRGMEALDRAGLKTTTRTLREWLSDAEHPIQKHNRIIIAAAYEDASGQWNPEIEQNDHSIKGIIQIGSDRRDRTLRIEWQENAPGAFRRIAAEWNRGTLTPARAEELFVEDVISENAVLENSTDEFEFPGSDYTVS